MITSAMSQLTAIGITTCRSYGTPGSSAAGKLANSESSHRMPRIVAAATTPTHKVVLGWIRAQRKSASRNTMIGHVVAMTSAQNAKGSFNVAGIAQRRIGDVARITPQRGAIQ